MQRHIAHYDYDLTPSYLEIKSDEHKAFLRDTIIGKDLSEPDQSIAIVFKDKDQVEWLYHQLRYILEKDR